MSSLPPEAASSQGGSVSGSIPAAVTDHSSYELGVITERERCARIADHWKVGGVDQVTAAAAEIAAAIRSGK